MVIYTVKRGDTLFSIANAYGADIDFLRIWNPVGANDELVVGQSILILQPGIVHEVKAGDSIYSIAQMHDVTPRQILAYNPNLNGGITPLEVGDKVIVTFDEQKSYDMRINGYAYPYIEDEILAYGLPYLTYLAPFTYGFTPSGTLVPLDDEKLISTARSYGTLALMHLSTLTEEGNFSNELASALLNDPSARNALIEASISNMREKGYAGIDIDFEFIYPEDAAAYASFIAQMRERANAEGFTVIAALAPKASATQSGLLYEGHDYAAIGAAANYVFLMTYEWGYTYGPPMAVSPIDSVRRVLDYAVSEIPPQKIFMGMPNYAYDWILPYKQGETRATLISNERAVELAREYGSEIKFDERAQTPYFNYYSDGNTHEVWFEDARSVAAKLALIPEYGFIGAGYWNMMRRFTQNWMIAATQYNIVTL